MEGTKLYDVMIIGGGPAGYTAGLYSARGGLRTLLIEKGIAGGQMVNTNEIDNYPGVAVGIDGFSLGDSMKRQAERFGVESLFGNVVSAALEGPVKKVTLENGESRRAKVVILAMGAVPRQLGVPGETEFRGRGVSYCATCDGSFFRNKVVSVVGGGNTALEDALFLAKICEKVYLIHRRDSFRASSIYVELAKQTENIELVLRENVAEIRGERAVTGLQLQSGRELACDGVFLAVGNLPNSSLIKGAVALDESGYVAADETTRTSLPGVFAVGDLRAKPLRQIVTAASDGAVAGFMAEKYLLEN